MDLILLNNIQHTPDAEYSSGNREGCLRGTRTGILLQLEDWLEDKESQPIFWLNGLAGTGKSTIAQTFAEVAFAEGKLGASFFCSRDSENRSNIQAIFPTLAFQLAYQYPSFRQQLLPVLRANPGIRHKSLCSQLEKAIVGPLTAHPIPTLIVIDALDECRDDQPASAILSVLSRYVDKLPTVKFFITGRPEPQIRSGFRLKSLQPITEILRLHEVEPSSVDSDISLFFRTRLNEIAKARSDCDFSPGWPDPFHINILCKKAAGFFIYAATVVKYVVSKSCVPTEQLEQIISLPQCTSQEGRGVDPLYTQILEQAVDVNASKKDKEKIYNCFRTVVGAVLLAFNPLSVRALSELLGTSNIFSTFYPLHSLFLVPEKAENPIQVFHKSFPDFLTDHERCNGKWFFVDPAVYHAKMFFSCLRLMRERLKRNICNLDDHENLSEVENLSGFQKAYIGDALEYSCRCWSKHLLGIPGNSPYVGEAQKAIDEFFSTSLLYWVEALVLTRNLGIGIYAMNNVEHWYTLVSTLWAAGWNLCQLIFRQKFHASGPMTPSVFCWKILTQFMTSLPRYTVLPSHSALLHHGFMSVIL